MSVWRHRDWSALLRSGISRRFLRLRARARVTNVKFPNRELETTCLRSSFLLPFVKWARLFVSVSPKSPNHRGFDSVISPLKRTAPRQRDGSSFFSHISQVSSCRHFYLPISKRNGTQGRDSITIDIGYILHWPFSRRGFDKPLSVLRIDPLK